VHRPADRQRDKETDMKEIFAFCNFAKAPNESSQLHCLKHSLFAVLLVRRKTFSFSLVSRRGVRNCSNLAKSIKSNTNQKLAKKVISKEAPCTYQPLASELFLFKV
jgi:hypothetical protein